MISYKDFLLTKVAFAPETGFEISKDKINTALKPHQRDAVMWAVKGGRRALFEAFGLGKTVRLWLAENVDTLVYVPYETTANSKVS